MNPERVRKYQEEREKYKDVQITTGKYFLKSNPDITYTILSVTGEDVTIQTDKSGFTKKKTLFWCQKNLKAMGS